VADEPPAARILRQKRVAFTLHEFDASVRSADDVARELGVPPERVYKTLVVESEPAGRKGWLVMVPATSELDLKALAVALGVKRMRMPAQRDAERLTAMQAGGISAIPLAGRGFSVLIDARALAHETILVSGGRRGADVQLRVEDLIAVTGARAVELGS
jgi:Cys-tRNA(Pro)/Cys-tRNA(Cys) deacylase